MKRVHYLKNLGASCKFRKKRWLGPIIFILIVLALMIVMAEGSALAPFI
ncbi:MAG: DUF5989 family protein [Bacteroidota bacterium]